ncbi:MAG: DUF6716 putative glycosyltransferase [Campylobacterota bacterium]|nr:DUF6716 putative glycosyltransferase [Campylobacterota bacterium]
MTIASGGNDINNIINKLEIYSTRPIIISLFPGITVENQIDAFITRLKSDLVLLNSKKDEAKYKKLCNIFKVPYNGFLYGASWYSKVENISCEIENKNYIVFFEQIDIPNLKNNRFELLTSLCNTAKKNPQKNFLIKSREEFINQDTSLFSLSKELTLPSNLNFTQIDTSVLIHNMFLGISISSSTCIESILANKRFVLISNYGYKNTFLNFYRGSNMILNLEDIDFDYLPVVNNKWKIENIINPYEQIDSLKLFLDTLNKKERKVKVDFFIWVKLFLLYYKVFIKEPKVIYKKVKKSILLVKD